MVKISCLAFRRYRRNGLRTGDAFSLATELTRSPQAVGSRIFFYTGTTLGVSSSQDGFILIKLGLVKLLTACGDVIRRRQREEVDWLQSDHVYLAGHLENIIQSTAVELKLTEPTHHRKVLNPRVMSQPKGMPEYQIRILDLQGLSSRCDISCNCQVGTHVVFSGYPRLDTLRFPIALVRVESTRIKLGIVMLGHPNVMITKFCALIENCVRRRYVSREFSSELT